MPKRLLSIVVATLLAVVLLPTVVFAATASARTGHSMRAAAVSRSRHASLRHEARRHARLESRRHHRDPNPTTTGSGTSALSTGGSSSGGSSSTGSTGASGSGSTSSAPTSTGGSTGSSPSGTQASQSGSPSSQGPVIGINVGSAIQWEMQFAQTLGARSVRMNFPIDTPTSQMDSIIGAYAQAGIRPDLLATFDGTMPTAQDNANLAAWAQRYGPGGSFWATGSYPASVAVTDIEYGNETSYQYEYPEIASNPQWYATSYYNQLAETYGQDYVQAVSDVNAVNSGVKVLAVADSPGDVPQWLAGMFQGAPSLKNVVEGWIFHPYGTTWQTDLNKTLAQTAALGASSSVPVYVTEVGVSTDNGNCLDGNYGFNACMTYAQAATTLTTQVQGIESDLGSRLAQLDLYSARSIDASGTSTDMEGYFGALQSDGQPKGAFTTAVESLLASTAS